MLVDYVQRIIFVKTNSLTFFHDHATFRCYYCTLCHLHVKSVLMCEYGYFQDQEIPFSVTK